MDLNKILEILGVDKLDESTQEEVKNKLQTIIETKVDEKMQPALKEAKEQLIQEYEEKFEEYKTDITSKFSNFVDSVLDEEMVIPEKVLEYARKGELYHELIEQFKTRLAIDEGLLDQEVKDLLKEARDEIVKLRDDLNDKHSEVLELGSKSQSLEAELYLRKKADGLTESQKARVFKVLEGVTDTEEIDRKFPVVVASLSEQDDDYDEDEDKKKKKDDEDEEDEEDEDMKEEGDKSKKGKGISEKVDDGDEDGQLNEKDSSPFSQAKKKWVQVLREGKI